MVKTTMTRAQKRALESIAIAPRFVAPRCQRAFRAIERLGFAEAIIRHCEAGTQTGWKITDAGKEALKESLEPRAVALLRAEQQFTRIMVRLFTRPTIVSVHTIKLSSQDADCRHLASLGLVEWWPGPGGWVFTELGNAWLKSLVDGEFETAA